jgi:hypothetical protein
MVGHACPPHLLRCPGHTNTRCPGCWPSRFCLTEDSSLQPEDLVKGVLATAQLGLLAVARWEWWCVQLASSKWQRCDRQLLQQLAGVQVRPGCGGQLCFAAPMESL